MALLTPKRLAVFMSRVQKSTHGCWIWTGSTDRKGYGRFWYHGNMRAAHHVLIGPKPEGKTHACHHCDNPPCVRPDHLFWGTHQDNVADLMMKRSAVRVSGDYLRKVRKSVGLTMTEVARRIHSSTPHICEVEKGRRHASQLFTAKFFAALGLPIPTTTRQAA
jgi:DNA-binding XRE family transcriptional regulator